MIFWTQALVGHYFKIILAASVALCFFVIEIVSMPREFHINLFC